MWGRSAPDTRWSSHAVELQRPVVHESEDVSRNSVSPVSVPRRWCIMQQRRSGSCCEEPVRGPNTNAEVWRYRRLLEPFVPNVLKLEWVLQQPGLPFTTLTCNKTQQLQSQKDTKTERSHMRLECRRQLCRSYFYVIKRSTCIISAYLQEQVVISVLALVSQHFEGTSFSSLKSESCSFVQVFLTISTLQETVKSCAPEGCDETQCFQYKGFVFRIAVFHPSEVSFKSEERFYDTDL